MQANHSTRTPPVAKLTAPAVPAVIPRRGNALSRALGNLALRTSGWQVRGEVPAIPKFVAIVAPHTSNWDFLVGVSALFALGIRVSFLGKDTLFRGPAGHVMRWLGGIPVDRASSNDVVRQNVAAFRNSERMVLAIAPEGTRRPVERWRTGFYHIAVGAGVPILPIAMDFYKRTLEIGKVFYPTGNPGNDIAQLRDVFKRVRGRHPRSDH